MEVFRRLWFRHIRKWTTKYKVDDIFVRRFGPFRSQAEDKFRRDDEVLAAEMASRGLIQGGIFVGAWLDLRVQHVAHIAEEMASIYLDAFRVARFPWPYRRDIREVVEGLERYRDGQIDGLSHWAHRIAGRKEQDRERFLATARPRIHQAVQKSISQVLADAAATRLRRRHRALYAIAAATAAGILGWWTGLVQATLGSIWDHLRHLLN